MNTNKHTIQRRIMRRVYYAFALRIVLNTITLKMGLFALALFAFAKLVHVSKVLESFSSKTLVEMPQYIFNVVFHAFMRGEVATLLAIGVMVFVALSLPHNVFKAFVPKVHSRATV